jgi:hypothetical protein
MRWLRDAAVPFDVSSGSCRLYIIENEQRFEIQWVHDYTAQSRQIGQNMFGEILWKFSNVY